MKYGATTYGFEVFENDIDFIAGGEAETIKACVSEAEHYALMAGPAASITIVYFERREIVEI